MKLLDIFSLLTHSAISYFLGDISRRGGSGMPLKVILEKPEDLSSSALVKKKKMADRCPGQ